MNYIQYSFKLEPAQPWMDILLAELSELPFESFEEGENELKAYIQESEWQENLLDELDILKNPAVRIQFTKESVPRQNWNENWEKQFDPVEVEDILRIYAPFHKQKDGFQYTLEIMPKMAFGTGHHPTTWSMVKAMNEDEWNGKSVLDMGCGTGILGLFARVKGAAEVHAIDIDEWAAENTVENFEANAQKIPEYCVCGNVNAIPSGKLYDVILANINRNVLLADIPAYAKHLKRKGKLYLSGFYTEDIPVLEKVFLPEGFTTQKTFTRNNWMCLVLEKA